MKIIISIVVGIIVALYCAFLFWCGGCDFNTRGEVLFMVALFTPAFGLLATLVTFNLWPEGNR